jgi:hypothetical protein
LSPPPTLSPHRLCHPGPRAGVHFPCHPGPRAGVYDFKCAARGPKHGPRIFVRGDSKSVRGDSKSAWGDNSPLSPRPPSRGPFPLSPRPPSRGPFPLWATDPGERLGPQKHSKLAVLALVLFLYKKHKKLQFFRVVCQLGVCC